MTLARNLGAVVLAAAWLLSVSQGTFSQANSQAQSPSPGPSDRTTAIPDQKLDAAAAVLERIASLKKDSRRSRWRQLPPPTTSGSPPGGLQRLSKGGHGSGPLGK